MNLSSVTAVPLRPAYTQVLTDATSPNTEERSRNAAEESNKLFGESLFDLIGERLRGLESGNVVLGNNDRRILRNVTCRFLCTLLQNETAETSQIDIILPCKRLFDRLHECFDGSKDGGIVNTSLLGNLPYNICFGHFDLVLGE